MATKPRILVMSDHSALHTGFACVSRNILNHLFDTGKYDIAEFGWFAPRMEDVKDRMPRWKVYVTDRTTAEASRNDAYGEKSLESAIVDWKPDILLSVGDEWMVKHVAPLRNRYGFTWIGYTPIDGCPHPPEWTKTFKAMDYCVAYGQWGKKVMGQRNPDVDKILWIPHGVRSDIFKRNKKGRKEIRERMEVKDNEILVGMVGRNQPRKQIPVLFKAFAMWSKPHSICPDTGKPWIVDPDAWYINELIYPLHEMPHIQESRKNAKRNQIPHEDGWNTSPFTGTGASPRVFERPNAKLYLHCALNDVGWNIDEQIARYRLRDKVIVFEDLKVGLGVPDEELANIYSSLDIFALPTIGEGFGLPILEAMSCGVPVCVTNYSGHTEFAQPGGLLIEPKVFYTEPTTNIERAICDVPHFVSCLDKLADDQELRKRCAHNGRFMAEKMDWRNIVLEWEKLVDLAAQKQTPTKYDDPEPISGGIEEL